jgi:ribosomal protein S20
MKTAIKKARTGIETKAENLDELFKSAQKTIAATARKGVIPAKTASRYVSRLKTAVNKTKA